MLAGSQMRLKVGEKAFGIEAVIAMPEATGGVARELADTEWIGFANGHMMTGLFSLFNSGPTH